MSRRPLSSATVLAATLATCGVLLLPAGTAGAAARAAVPAPGSVPPDQDPFYAAPADIADYRPGQVVASRPVPNPTLDWIPMPVDVWQLSYRSNDSNDQPELAVTSLVVPKRAWTGAGARPVVSLQSPEDSLGTQCAPSYLLAGGQDNQDAALGVELLAANWAVAIPDHEGPKSVFLAGPQEGHAVLDGIRAVRDFGADGIGKANPWALSGYSGGANATGWAAQLQPGYAPDVPLVGAAIGGTPAAPRAVAKYIDGTSFAGFEFAAAYGVATEWPGSGITSLLNPRGQQDFAGLRGQCESAILSSFAFRRLNEDTTVPDPFGVPSVAAVLQQDTLGAQPPVVPVYDYHADTDEIVPVGQDDQLVSDWCAKGATVQSVRDLLGEHVEEAAVRETAVSVYLGDRFAGRPAPSSC
ncbi:lipase family protein [Kitasatospora viridis]|uniref:Secretory lipase n=1 Tax=Kitasatospora viridis TaxID=281105 RepID=A0A561UQ56_9ACTN|nr:lipase family protein [Kitasatospora viridis]TWG01490.1 secretory lipase [Kitasatospora viridis]